MTRPLCFPSINRWCWMQRRWNCPSCLTGHREDRDVLRDCTRCACVRMECSTCPWLGSAPPARNTVGSASEQRGFFPTPFRAPDPSPPLLPENSSQNKRSCKSPCRSITQNAVKDLHPWARLMTRDIKPKPLTTLEKQSAYKWTKKKEHNSERSFQLQRWMRRVAWAQLSLVQGQLYLKPHIMDWNEI